MIKLIQQWDDAVNNYQTEIATTIGKKLKPLLIKAGATDKQHGIIINNWVYFVKVYIKNEPEIIRVKL